MEKIRIFIGSSTRHFIEERVCAYSLMKHSSLPIECNIIDASTGSVRFSNGKIWHIPEEIKERLNGYTSFSLARYGIPEWCEFNGRALYCDSDTLFLQDPRRLWEIMPEKKAAAAVPVAGVKCPEHYDRVFLNQLRAQGEFYLTSVMALNCNQLRPWKLDAIAQGLALGDFTYDEMMWLGKNFRGRYDCDVFSLPAEWNHLDLMQNNTKLIHFTEIETQPWRYDHHFAGSVWEKYYLEAMAKGFLSLENVQNAYRKKLISKKIFNLALVAWGKETVAS